MSTLGPTPPTPPNESWYDEYVGGLKSSDRGPQIVADETALIKAVNEAEPDQFKKIQKAGLVVFASIGTALAFLTGGVFVRYSDAREYLKNIWDSQPLTADSAKKVAAAYNKLYLDLEATFQGKESRYQKITEDPRWEIYRTYFTFHTDLPKAEKRLTDFSVLTSQIHSIAKDLTDIHANKYTLMKDRPSPDVTILRGNEIFKRTYTDKK